MDSAFAPAPPVSAAELRSARSPTRDLLDRAADTIDDLEGQCRELELGMAALQAQFPAAPPPRPKAQSVLADAAAEWLGRLDPAQLDRLIDPAISRAFIEASMASDRIVSEASERVERLIDHAADAIAELIEIVDAARTTPESIAALPQQLSRWEGGFAGSTRAVITQLRLPYTVGVADLIELVGVVATDAQRGSRPRRKRSQDGVL